MTVGVFGLGRFGSFWSSLLSRRFAVQAYDIDPDRRAEVGVTRVSLEELCTCKTIFLCVSIRSMREVLRLIQGYLSAETLIIDTCSVKVYPGRWMLELLPPSVHILASHPMFGPESAKAGLDELPIMLDPIRLGEEQTRFWEETFASFGLSVVRMDCDRHDREAAYSQALTHFVGRSLHSLGLPETEIATRWYTKLHSVAKQCVRDSNELFQDMQCFNPYTESMRSELLASFAATRSDLDSCIKNMSLDVDSNTSLESKELDITKRPEST
ncbi:prephenate dehydrogenase/arogenate dehydrogenase family protein [Treponema sp.]